MAFTTIRLVRNKTGLPVTFTNFEDAYGQHPHILDPGAEWQCSQGVPWHNNVFGEHNIAFSIDYPPVSGSASVSLCIYTQNGYVWCVKAVPWDALPDLNNPYTVGGNAVEGGDRVVEITGSSKDDLALTFY